MNALLKKENNQLDVTGLFCDIKSVEHRIRPHMGEQLRIELVNGYGVSIITGADGFYSGEGTFEVATLERGAVSNVLSPDENEDGIFGWQTANEAVALLRELSKLASCLRLSK